MQPEYGWLRVEGKVFDVGEEGREVTDRRTKEGAVGGQRVATNKAQIQNGVSVAVDRPSACMLLMLPLWIFECSLLLLNDVGAVDPLQHRLEEPLVLVISDPPSVVTLSCEVGQRFERDLLVVSQKHLTGRSKEF